MEDLNPAPKPVYIDPSQRVEIARADFTVAGDLMLHLPIVRTSAVADGYVFDDIFTYVKPYLAAADYAVANLETTLSGTDGKDYTGFPNFNSPDQFALSAQSVGFDLLLTGNNHCYDYGTAGLQRTLSTLKDYRLDTLGTVESRAEPRHMVKNINGIKVGMACYTFADIDEEGNVTINNLTTDSTSAGLINAFDYDKLSQFYTEVEGEIASMKAGGADTIILYIHWGDELNTNASDDQKAIAQKLCDLGVDVIAGSHPHVVQPIDLLTSTTDPEHTTVCMYSMGNAVSNQRLGLIPASTTAHTEDGMLFSVTFTKYSDGTVALTYTDILPCWVNRHDVNGSRQYDILPLDDATRDQWAELYGLTNYTLSCCEDSYDRTTALVSEGLIECQTFLTEREATFLAEVNGQQ